MGFWLRGISTTEKRLKIYFIDGSSIFVILPLYALKVKFPFCMLYLWRNLEACLSGLQIHGVEIDNICK